jgi:hypothetical protein
MPIINLNNILDLVDFSKRDLVKEANHKQFLNDEKTILIWTRSRSKRMYKIIIIGEKMGDCFEFTKKYSETL